MCHPYLVTFSAVVCDRKMKEKGGGYGGEGGEDVACGLCKDTVEDKVVAECGDVFCRMCLEEYLGQEMT